MIFSIIILVLIGVIAFFHYTQGFFSSAISVVLAAISAAIAISYQEPIVVNWLGGKFADEANGMTVIVLFAVCYCVLRFIFDAAIPGNVRLPVLMDKIGAGVMGLFAGIIAAGVLALGAQMLPFGPNIAGYGRFPTNDSREVSMSLQGMAQMQNVDVIDELKNNNFDADSQQKMILPADDWVVNFVSYLSQPAGALAGERTLTSVHPDWLNELFADRLGIEVGGKRVAMNLAKTKEVQVSAIYALASLPQISGESPNIRSEKLSDTVSSDAQHQLLVIRTTIDHDATDSDNLFRFSMASCRLVTNGKVFYGIGTVEGGSTLLASHLDDFLFTEIAGGSKAIDIAFLVPKSDVLAPAKTGQPQHLADGVYFQVKRLGWVDLGGKEVTPTMPVSTETVVMRKADVLKALHPPEEQVSAPLEFEDTKNSNQIFTPINVGTADTTVKDQQLSSGIISLKDGKFSKLDINATDTIQRMRQGGYPVDTLFVPPGKMIVQLSCRPSGDNPWQWAGDLAQFTLVTTDGQKIPPSGALAKLKSANGQDKLAAIYDAATPPSSLSTQDGRPTDVWLIYQLPAGAQIKQWDYQGKLVHPM